MKLSEEQERKIREFWEKRIEELKDDEDELILFEVINELITSLNDANVIKSTKDAYKIYVKQLKKSGNTPFNEYIIKLGPGLGKKTFNKDLLEAVIGETQDSDVSCSVAAKGLAAKYLIGKRPPDGKIIATGGIENATNGKITEERINKVSFSNLEKRIEKGEILGSGFDRNYTYAETALCELETDIAEVLGYKYLCLVRADVEMKEKLRLDILSPPIRKYIPFLLKEERGTHKFCEKVVAPGSKIETELFPEKKIKKRKVREKRVYVDPLSLKTEYKLIFKRVLRFSLRASAHDILILGTRRYKKKKYVIIYDVNYKRAKLPPVYELPFEAFSEERKTIERVFRFKKTK